MMTLPQFLEIPATAHSAESDTLAAQQGFVSALKDLSLIQVSGDDAASYLHNLLSNDIEHLTLTSARHAALCTPKGRMLASFFIWKTSDGIFLQLSASILAPVQKRLQMFVMRAKAKLNDVSTEYTALGLGGLAATKTLLQWFPQLPSEVNGKVDTEFGSLIRVSDAYGHARYLWIIQSTMLNEYWPVLQSSLTPCSAALWRRTDIMAGIARIIDKTQEQFVPQMVNFELIGGINFKKGCYPGQEIVARSQYLGKLKRRMAIASIPSTAVMAGMEVFSEEDPDQPCGMIVNAEADNSDSSICLVELKVADQEANKVHLGAADGAPLHFLPLPYAMLDVTQ
ncbi:YgfZ/GcvT domain-containing protein [Undibacterium sp. Ren11W]|uniref:CAF17-like 4Fe-4S cluster assembly/insertion protein YgfZ n=1 Tax=Undibacterium sp. Ren11W TaxID=3413045 RepID=UPI003BF37E18